MITFVSSLYGQTRSEVKHHLIRWGHMTYRRIGSKNGEKNNSECLVLCPMIGLRSDVFDFCLYKNIPK